MTDSLDVRFYGVRGSTPCPCDANKRYGGNTSCVVLEADGADPILLDMGTGLRYFGMEIDREPATPPFRGTALVSHLHWDHVQGLPFFSPINRSGAHLDVFGPADGNRSMKAAFASFMNPPYFPICIDDLAGNVAFHDVCDGTMSIGPAVVTTRKVPHVGVTNGYRIDWGSVSVAYISDHQQPVDDPHCVDEAVLELADGVDLLIHDAQFTAEEFAQRSDWGHSTVAYALEVAHQASVSELALFHHDPSHCDETVDGLLAWASDAADGMDIGRVSAPAEGQTVKLVAA
ncbi:MAG: hypothetical protein ISR43_04560 [Acidimicrobiia bacterium]|nr:hypothetical protein [Actinomycetota bacterium]MBL6924483.1 hypothetical protein [Acidimicrobiia bacterium]MBL6926483.1 hypothetical protein [Acidimicrobiia bacterium]